MRPSLGIFLQLGATLAFAIMSTLVRGVADEVSSGLVVFARSMIGLVPLLVWLGMRGELRGAFATTHIGGHVVRGLVGVSSMWAGFAALAFIPLAEAIAFTYVTPLVTVVLAALILSERVPAYRWLAVGIGFVGIITMLAPILSMHGLRAEGAAAGVGLALFGAIGAGFAVTQVRRLTQTETTGSIVFYFSIVAAAASLVTVPQWSLPSWQAGLMLVGVGISGGIGQIPADRRQSLCPRLRGGAVQLCHLAVGGGLRCPVLPRMAALARLLRRGPGGGGRRGGRLARGAGRPSVSNPSVIHP